LPLNEVPIPLYLQCYHFSTPLMQARYVNHRLQLSFTDAAQRLRLLLHRYVVEVPKVVGQLIPFVLIGFLLIARVLVRFGARTVIRTPGLTRALVRS
jgi:hypothetical protein